MQSRSMRNKWVFHQSCSREKTAGSSRSDDAKGLRLCLPPEVQGWRRDRLATDFLEVAGRHGFKEVAENG